MRGTLLFLLSKNGPCYCIFVIAFLLSDAINIITLITTRKRYDTAINIITLITTRKRYDT